MPNETLPPFQKLLDEHGSDVLGFLVASVGPHDAEDCFQETFIAALRAYPRLEHTHNLRSWLLTIAHRKAIELGARELAAPFDFPGGRMSIVSDPQGAAFGLMEFAP